MPRTRVDEDPELHLEKTSTTNTSGALRRVPVFLSFGMLNTRLLVRARQKKFDARIQAPGTNPSPSTRRRVI